MQGSCGPALRYLVPGAEGGEISLVWPNKVPECPHALAADYSTSDRPPSPIPAWHRGSRRHDGRGLLADRQPTVRVEHDDRDLSAGDHLLMLNVLIAGHEDIKFLFDSSSEQLAI